ncbi:uncharacterized protein LOC120092972 [Benincasa hispida]|uniref:uncharacterized protein LOC120092972 n=1 Tax=Benincasa hispida TaxID=102211 RepID=UPI0019010F02|nr:uncharacterized protein LOC120092972 [Benincasa hispida]
MRMFKLVGIKEKLGTAQLIEDTEEAHKRKWGSRSPNPSQSVQTTGSTITLGTGSTSGQGNVNNIPTARTISLNPSRSSITSSNSVTLRDVNGKALSVGNYKRLSDSDMQSRGDKGLCYRCDERYSPGHRCKKELNLLIHPDEEEEEAVVEKGVELENVEGITPAMLENMEHHPTILHPTEAEIAELSIEDEIAELSTEDEIVELSLNSFAGIDSPKTVKLMGTVGDNNVVVLIDSGATHNFIDDQLVSTLNLPCSPTSSCGIMLGTGKSVRTNGICKGVVLNLPNLTIINDFFPIPLGSADVVMGVQWLMTLGQVECDWSTSKMDFQVGERRVHLKADRSLVKSQISLKSMMKHMMKAG